MGDEVNFDQTLKGGFITGERLSPVFEKEPEPKPSPKPKKEPRKLGDRLPKPEIKRSIDIGSHLVQPNIRRSIRQESIKRM